MLILYKNAAIIIKNVEIFVEKIFLCEKLTKTNKIFPEFARRARIKPQNSGFGRVL